jgi:anthranilate synthase
VRARASWLFQVFKEVNELEGKASFQTRGGITVHRTVEQVDGYGELERFTDTLDGRRGAIFKSSYEYPGRYNRWSLGFVNPPIELSCNARAFKLEALNSRGDVLLPAICAKLQQSSAVATLATVGRIASGTIAPAAESFAEEDRSRQPSIFSILREIVDLFHCAEDHNLGMYGSFGYDLAFQFEDVPLARDRADDHRDIVMWLPDAIVCIDEHSSKAWRIEYDFDVDGSSTKKAGPRDENPEAPFVPTADAGEGKEPVSDHKPGEYADLVRKAKGEFMCGNLFECVPSQTFSKPCPAPPSEIFRRVQERNPAPFSFLINLGEEEFLVGASPEMFVRCDGKRVETCPISGTIKRGKDAVGDALQIQALLNSKKDESELTMCTDVDRNDKSRICRPGSVAVIGRRQIEMYSRLIHTVDHVEGYLRDGLDAMDAFLAHTWAVTVTGAPKTWAMRFVEKNEKTPRCWYGGAVGMIRFDGTLNTGLTLRTIRIKRGTAQVRHPSLACLLQDSVRRRAGADTLLY